MASSIPGSGVSTLFITNLPRITDADFTQLFSQSGCVSSRLETDRAGNQVGYVDFPDEAAAMTARNFYSGWKVGGENGPGLSLELATTFPSGGSGAGQQGAPPGATTGAGGSARGRTTTTRRAWNRRNRRCSSNSNSSRSRSILPSSIRIRRSSSSTRPREAEG